MSWAEEVFNHARCSLTTRSVSGLVAVNLVRSGAMIRSCLVVLVVAGLAEECSIPSRSSSLSSKTVFKVAGLDLPSVLRKPVTPTIRAGNETPGAIRKRFSRMIQCAGEGDLGSIRLADQADSLPAGNRSVEGNPPEWVVDLMGGNQGSQQSISPYYGSVYGGASMGPSPQFSFTPPGNDQVVQADPFNDQFKLLMDDLYQRMKARAANDTDNPFFAQDIGWADDSTQVGF